MTTLHTTPFGPCIERKFGCGAYTAVHKAYPMHVAAIQSVREQIGLGETFKRLPWVRQRDTQGRFIRRDAGRVAA